MQRDGGEIGWDLHSRTANNQFEQIPLGPTLPPPDAVQSHDLQSTLTLWALQPIPTADGAKCSVRRGNGAAINRFNGADVMIIMASEHIMAETCSILIVR